MLRKRVGIFGWFWLELIAVTALLIACGETPPTTNPATTQAVTSPANPTTQAATTTTPTSQPATSAPATTASTTVAPTTAATTEIGLTTPSQTFPADTTTAPTTTEAALPTGPVAAPAWFKDVPAYPNTQKLTLTDDSLKPLGLDPKQFYVSSVTTADPVNTVLDFYTGKLKDAGWQVGQQVPLSSDGQGGKQITFTRTQNGTAQLLILLVATPTALKTVPNTVGLASQLSAGQNLLMLITKTDQTVQGTPNAPSEAPTTGLPTGVAAKNLSFDFGDGWVAQGQITYPANKPGPFPAVILVHGSGLNDMDETIPEAESGVPGGAKFFRPIAYYLPTRGIAVVRYNKRGVVGIGPKVSSDQKLLNLAKPDTQYTLDADFVLKETLKNPLVDPKRVVLLGHSEGTLDVSHVAVGPDGQSLAGLVLMGVVGYDAKTVMRYQLVDRQVQALSAEADTDKDGKLSPAEFLKWLDTQPASVKASNIQGLFDADAASPAGYKYKASVDTNGDNLLDLNAELKPLLETSTGINNFPNLKGLPPSQIAFLADWQQNGSVTSTLPPFKKPVLMMNGEGDIQTVVQSAREADAALGAAGNPDHTLKTYPGLGHSFYPAKGFDQPLGPPQDNVLKDLGDWLTGHLTT